MKSGTSFIQNVLGENKKRLADAGVLFAGPRWRFQVRAVQQLIGYGGEGQEPMPEAGPWRTLVEEIDAHPGIAVISMEFLGPRTEAKIEQLVADFPDTPVEAILTCRDLGRTIPAMWVEAVQNGGITDWADYLDAVRHRRSGDRVSRGFWKHQDIPGIATRWAGVLGEDRISLVTVPPPGAAPDVLWRRFTDAAGIEAEDCELDVRANRSIGLASALLLLRLNQSFHQESGGMPRYYDPYVKHKLAKRGLVHRSRQEPKLGLDERWVVKLGEAQIERVQKAGHRVVGDLFDLMPAPVPGIHADEVGQDEILDAALAGLGQALDGWSAADKTHRRRIRALEKKR